MSAGRRRMVARRALDATPQSVFDFLADLRNHWKLADRWIEVSSLNTESDGHATGGVVLVHGPLGLRRAARIRILPARNPASIEGWASVGAHTRAHVVWSIEPLAQGSAVSLSVEILSAGLLDRLLLAAGGSRWLQRRLAATLRALARAEPAAAPAHPPKGVRGSV